MSSRLQDNVLLQAKYDQTVCLLHIQFLQICHMFILTKLVVLNW